MPTDHFAANQRVVLLPIQTADLTYLPLLQAVEGPLLTCITGLNTLYGQLAMLRRDMAPNRWMSSPYLRYDEIIEQRTQWAALVQGRYFLCPTLQIHAAQPLNNDSATPTDGNPEAIKRTCVLQARLYDAHTQEDIGHWESPLPAKEAPTLEDLTTLGHQWLKQLYTHWQQQHGTHAHYQPNPTPPPALVPDMATLQQVQQPYQLDEVINATPPSSATGWLAYVLGKHLQTRGDHAEARTYLEQAIHSDIGNTSFKAQCHLACGQALALQEQWPQALQHWQTARQLDSNDPDIALNLGYGLENCERDNEAITTFSKLQRQKPKDIRASYALGQLYSKHERWKEAIQQYTLQTQLAPTDPWPFNNMATCYLQMGQPNKAKPYLEKTCVLDPAGEAGNIAQLILAQLENNPN